MKKKHNKKQINIKLAQTSHLKLCRVVKYYMDASSIHQNNPDQKH